MQKQETNNLTIIGDSITGNILALSIDHFSKNRLPVNIIKINSSKTKKKDIRSIVLSYHTFKKLSEINVWNNISKYSVPISDVEVSCKNYIGKIKILSKDYNLPNLGFVVDYDRIKRSITQLTKKKDIKVYKGQEIICINRERNKVSIVLKNGRKIDTKLLVIACGYDKKIFNYLGISYKKKKYNQVAIVANIHTTIANTSQAFERFIPNGSIAILPKGNHKNALILCISKNYYDFDILNKHQLRKDIQRNFGNILGKIKIISNFEIYNLEFKISKKHIHHRIALIGSSAQILHPLAAQGLNLGIRDAITLSKSILNNFKNKKDIGNYRDLVIYQKNRIIDQNNTIKFINILLKILDRNSFFYNLLFYCGLSTSFITSYFYKKFIEKILNIK